MKYLLLILIGLFFLSSTSFQVRKFKRFISRQSSQIQQQSNGQYNMTTSKRTFFIAAVSGCPKKCIQNWDCKLLNDYPGVRQVTYIKNDITSLVGFIGYDSIMNQIVLSWRGSADIRNWLQDFTFDTLQYSYCKGCRIHAGFYQMFRTNQGQIMSAFEGLIKKYPNAKVLATGHSMGAALSIVSAIQIAMKYNIPRQQMQIHNFGCPRVGNPSFATFVDTKIGNRFRVVHYKDLVPHVPQQEFEYKHIANQVFFDKDFTSYQVCNDSGQDSSCSNKFAPDYTMVQHGFYFIDMATLHC